MSIGFMCGDFGCRAIEINDEHLRIVQEKREIWAIEQKNITGKFPEMDDQVEFVENWLNRLSGIKIAGKP